MSYRPGHIEGKERITVYIDEDMARRLRVLSAERKESMSAIIERALRKELSGMLDRDEFARTLGYADYEALCLASERVAVEGDVTWYITRLPDGRWAAWDDAEIALDRVTYHGSRDAALRYQWDGWQDAGGDRDDRVRWLAERPTDK